MKQWRQNLVSNDDPTSNLNNKSEDNNDVVATANDPTSVPGKNALRPFTLQSNFDGGQHCDFYIDIIIFLNLIVHKVERL